MYRRLDMSIDKVAIVAYHGKCLDGFTSYWVARKGLLDRGYDAVHGIEMFYNQDSYDELTRIMSAIPEAMELFIVDFSVPVAELELYQEVYPNIAVTVLDHHKTALEKYYPGEECNRGGILLNSLHNAEIILDMNRSGAGMCWEYFYPDTHIPSLVAYVQDYDLWKFDLGVHTKWVNKFLKNMPMNICSWNRMYHDMEDNKTMNLILDEGKNIQGYHDEQVEAIVSVATPTEIQGYRGYIVQCNYEFVSDVGHKLAVHDDSEFGLMFSIDIPTNKIKWGIRGNGSVDVSAIAKIYGGGGHHNAAGFETQIIDPVYAGEPSDG